MSRIHVGILLLAAGGSSRMGRPKQLLRIGNKSLVRIAAEAAIEALGDPTVVVTGSCGEQVAAQLGGLPLHVAHNAGWERGMGSSIRHGVESILKLGPHIGALLITLCDQPGVSAQTLRKLLDAQIETGASLCAASFDETVGPPALFTRAFFDDLLSLPDEAGAKQLLLKHSGSLCRVNCPEAARDVDTPDDYDAVARPP